MTIRHSALGLLIGSVVTMAFPARANQDVALAEVLRSWHGEPAAFVELRFLADDQGEIRGSKLVFTSDDGSPPQTLAFDHDVPNGNVDARVLIATDELWSIAAVQRDFRIVPDYFPSGSGMVCYQALNPDGSFTTPPRGCIRWGSDSSPDSKSLVRDGIGVKTASSPTPQNNVGTAMTLLTSCGDGLRQDWETCDGSERANRTCADYGFFAGDLRCEQCEFDTQACTNCGNGIIDRGEQCDGDQLDGTTCSMLGYTSGELSCSARCAFDESVCAGRQLGGGGSRRSDCALEWNIEGGGSRTRGRTARCTDGDPSCDADTDTPGSCGFRVQLCFNRKDQRRACAPGALETFKLITPDSRSDDAPKARMATTLLDAVAALGGSVEERSVVFSPPLTTPDACTEPVIISVPTCEPRGHGATCRGATTLVTRTEADALGHRDRDRIELQCIAQRP